MIVRVGLALVGSYLLGSLPTAYLLVKWRTGTDIRRVGSGNVGATNAARAAGKGLGTLVFLIDAAKGIAATFLPVILLPVTSNDEARLLDVMRLFCGGMAVLGHNFPWSLGFRGGKGVATTFGALLGADAVIAGLAGAAWLIAAALSRYVSIASMVAAIAIPLGQWRLGRSPVEVALGAALGGLIMVRHHGNIARLLAGREPRIGTRSSAKTHAS